MSSGCCALRRATRPWWRTRRTFRVSSMKVACRQRSWHGARGSASRRRASSPTTPWPTSPGCASPLTVGCSWSRYPYRVCLLPELQVLEMFPALDPDRHRLGSWSFRPLGMPLTPGSVRTVRRWHTCPVPRCESPDLVGTVAWWAGPRPPCRGARRSSSQPRRWAAPVVTGGRRTVAGSWSPGWTRRTCRSGGFRHRWTRRRRPGRSGTRQQVPPTQRSPWRWWRWTGPRPTWTGTSTERSSTWPAWPGRSEGRPPWWPRPVTNGPWQCWRWILPPEPPPSRHASWTTTGWTSCRVPHGWKTVPSSRWNPGTARTAWWSTGPTG